MINSSMQKHTAVKALLGNDPIDATLILTVYKVSDKVNFNGAARAL
jgi:hypothetical protein